MHIPALISDLAVMLITAGFITIIFKKLKQPLVLGYVLAGFLISAYFPFFPTVVDTENISTWSEIGIIFLMFHLGLEFNLHKLAEVGGTAIITAIVKMSGMLVMGYAAGRLLGFGTMDSIFLGGMLSMSSTIIIIKALEELGLKKAKFAEPVFGTLVVEDIAGIFMMIILSTISVSKNVSGGQMFISLSVMLLYLIVWVVLGIYFLPTFLNRTMRLMNDEMVMIMSLGICFGMVILAEVLGFSSALGAFLAGSLMAGTVHVKKVESVTKGVKDLFGAIFFLSVGMMVDPGTLVEYAGPIIVITLVTVAGKLIFSSLGMLLSGQTLETAVLGGFSLGQIGEFAFIIASLGMSLGVTGDYLYPVVVAVSVITTFATPFFIKAAPGAVKFLEKHLPDKLVSKLNRYTSDEQISREKDNDWYAYLKKYLFRLTVFGGIMLTSAIFGVGMLAPFLREHMNDTAANVIACVVIYGIMAVFTGALMNMHNTLFTSLWLKKNSFRLPLLVLNLIKVAVVAAIAMIPLGRLFRIHTVLLLVIVAAAVAALAKTDILTTWYLQLQTTFLRNFNEVLLAREESRGGRQKWIYDTLRIISFYAPKEADFLKKPIKDLDLGRKYSVYVVKISRGEKHTVMPRADDMICAGDKVYVIGEEKDILNFYKLIDSEPCKRMRTLRQFMESDYPDAESALAVGAVKITGEEDFSGKPVKYSNITSHWNCMVIGFQRHGLPVVMPNANMMICKDDIMWIAGSNNNVGRLMARYVIEEEEV